MTKIAKSGKERVLSVQALCIAIRSALGMRCAFPPETNATRTRAFDFYRRGDDFQHIVHDAWLEVVDCHRAHYERKAWCFALGFCEQSALVSTD
jgi:hypothetical protein